MPSERSQKIRKG